MAATDRIKNAIIDKLKAQYEGSFIEAYEEACKELSLDPSESLMVYAQDVWVRNATRYLK